MKVSNKIEIDLTKSLANVGTSVPFCGDFVPDGNLLPYPNAKLDKVSVQFDVTFVNPNVEVTGKILCDVVGKCDRCLTDVKKQFVLPFSQIFFRETAEDPDSYCYAASKLDATKAVQDEIILGLPTLLLCQPECKGLCPKCGQNLNDGECGCDREKENVFSQLKNLKF